MMNGAESLVRTLVAGGVDVCFANPGTSEMHFVAALDRVEGMRCVLGLFEGVVTGAADGYYRMKGTPASTLLHLGPGLANGLANLHNAKKANSGIVNIVGQHAVYHIGFNAPLTSDIEGLARPMSAWVRTSPDAKSVARDGAAAIAAAKSAPPQIATLILPADTAWNEADGIAEVPVESQRASYSSQAVDNAAKVLRGGAQTLLLLTGGALTERGLALAAQISGKTGCKVMGQTYNPRMARGRRRVLPADGGGASARLAAEHGRLDRVFDAGRNRRRGGVPGPQGDLHGRRRQRDVYAAIAVDAGARRPQRHHHRVRQSHLSDSARRIRRRRRRLARPARAR